MSETETAQKLRIACYGHIRQHGGSGVGAQYLVIEELLKRGFNIDFYGWKGFIYPKGLLKYSNFNYVDVTGIIEYQDLKDRSLLSPWLRMIPTLIKKLLQPLVYLFIQWTVIYNTMLVQRQMLVNHEVQQYDLLLIVELFSPFEIKGIPTISWVPSAPQTEWQEIQKLKSEIISLCGIGLYLQLQVFYALKALMTRSIKNSDLLICSSGWSKERLVEYGFDPQIIKVLPYAIDVQRFQVSAQRKPELKRPTVFLWLGRIDPRKRLDLLLEAYRLILQERQDVSLKIIGKTRYAKGYQQLIDNFEFPEAIDYQAAVPQAQVPEVMAECDFLIQPSQGENFGSSVAEALCCGLPVIVGPTNGTKDFISKSSLVFPEYTAEALKETMLKAIEISKQNPEQSAIDARQTAEEYFDVVKIVDRLENILHEVVPQPPSCRESREPQLEVAAKPNYS